MDRRLRVENGYLIPTEGPGLRAELNMKELKRHLVEV